MVNMLPDLNNSAPSVRGEFFLAVITLHVALNEFGDESLFNFGFIIQLLLNCDLNFYSLGVGLCPNKSSVDDFSFIQSPYFFKQNRQ